MSADPSWTYVRGRSPDALKVLPTGCALAVCGDPPYGLKNPQYGRRQNWGGDHDGSGRGAVAQRIEGDDDLSVLESCLPEMSRVLHPRVGVALICMAPSQFDACRDLFRSRDWHWWARAEWYKGRPGISQRARYCHEDIHIFTPHSRDPFNHRGPLVMSIRASVSQRRPPHPNYKPPKLFLPLLSWAMSHDRLDDLPEPPLLVVDPWAGTAPIGCAAIRLMLPYYGVECDSRWWEPAERELRGYDRGWGGAHSGRRSSEGQLSLEG